MLSTKCRLTKHRGQMDTLAPSSDHAGTSSRLISSMRRMPSIHYGQTALHSSTQPTVLIPKKDGAEAITDFRPISLIHSFAKIIAKVLALRLAPHMSFIVSPTQSAFIKRRSIHDNYMAVRNAIRRYHNSKLPTIFLKLDIAKAFDSVRWEYLLTLLNKLGFPSRWQDWIAALLFTSSTRFLLNGIPNAPIKHGRGLRQGDPLSPLLFVIAMDPL